jgi:hypothetical protein
LCFFLQPFTFLAAQDDLVTPDHSSGGTEKAVDAMQKIKRTPSPTTLVIVREQMTTTPPQAVYIHSCLVDHRHLVRCLAHPYHISPKRTIKAKPDLSLRDGSVCDVLLCLFRARKLSPKMGAILSSPSVLRGGEGGASYLDGELALREVHLVLLGLLQLSRRVGGREASADRTGLLGSQVQGSVLLVLVEQTQLSALLQVDDSEHASDRLAEIVTVMQVQKSVISSRTQ